MKKAEKLECPFIYIIFNVYKIAKYLGFWVDNKVSFKCHIKTETKKLQLNVGVFYGKCLTEEGSKELLQASFLLTTDIGDLVLMHISLSLQLFALQKENISIDTINTVSSFV